ncbi:hypothetical protein [Roseibacillus ishigakijimensis]|uniref:Uncharacterized protein n=1 Tax=Roseibacillus ishigakijimensis TaxID=454146 RepID=A0A934VP10_9BACT|nr:hypothetical protein [Roseibacillus ishigakijimensis]MBK1835621.1 hypothetical protein [Roseibacillus ishigakijimensis]
MPLEKIVRKAWFIAVSGVDDAAAAFVIMGGSGENGCWCGEITALLGRGPGGNPRALPWADMCSPVGAWGGRGVGLGWAWGGRGVAVGWAWDAGTAVG